jgi:hypothetical protein
MILRFGKYKGYDLMATPDDYLDWLIAVQEKTLAEYRCELERRRALQDAKLSWVDRIVQTGFRNLAMQYHPDRGGDDESMRQVVAAHERLKVLVKGSGLK